MQFCSFFFNFMFFFFFHCYLVREFGELQLKINIVSYICGAGKVLGQRMRVQYCSLVGLLHTSHCAGKINNYKLCWFYIKRCDLWYWWDDNVISYQSGTMPDCSICSIMCCMVREVQHICSNQFSCLLMLIIIVGITLHSLIFPLDLNS